MSIFIHFEDVPPEFNRYRFEQWGNFGGNMASYLDVKEEAIRIIDEFATQHEVEKRYGLPKYKPHYSASSKLAALGINVWVRRAMPKRVSTRMHKRFGVKWKGVGITQLEAVETIGAFIVLMCLLTSTPIGPHPEPT